MLWGIPTDVVLATARSLGIRVAPTDDSALVLQEAGTLPRDRQQLLVDVARAFIEGQEALTRQDPAGPADEDLTQDMLGPAARKGDRNISPDELPYE